MPADEALERKRLRRSTRVGRGRLAWDKDRTRELFRRYKEEGDEEAREQLIESHLNLVRFLASKFKNRGEPLEDLVQVGSGPHQGYRPLRSRPGLGVHHLRDAYHHGRDKAPLP